MKKIYFNDKKLEEKRRLLQSYLDSLKEHYKRVRKLVTDNTRDKAIESAADNAASKFMEFYRKHKYFFKDVEEGKEFSMDRGSGICYDITNLLYWLNKNKDMKKIAFAEPNRADNAIYVTARSIFRVLEEIYKKLGTMIRDEERNKKFENFAKDKIAEAAIWYNRNYKHVKQCE
jgi:hypothetical protein